MRAYYENARWGRGGIAWIDDWDRLLDGPTDRLVEVCVSEDEYAIDMRQVGPFMGVLTQEERLEAIERARTR
jgi:hypothetical protein